MKHLLLHFYLIPVRIFFPTSCKQRLIMLNYTNSEYVMLKWRMDLPNSRNGYAVEFPERSFPSV